MKPTFQGLALLAAAIGLAGTSVAQWRHFGEERKTPDTAEPATKTPLPREIVADHNAVRAGVGIQPLVWSGSLAAVAQEWANKLIANGQFVHSHNPNFGENLYEIDGGLAMPAEVVAAWAGEVKDYNYRSNTCSGVCGHYTQIVWADTKEVGCAWAQHGRRQVWVCEYNPPGNWVGRKPY